MMCFFCFKQKTAYELRISDWSSDVCSSDLPAVEVLPFPAGGQNGKRAGAACLRARTRTRSEHKRPIDRRGHYAVPGSVPGKGAPVYRRRSEERRVGKECVRTW